MKASIIVPVYNASATLSKTLDSIAAQTETDFEAILVDDCSSDSSPEICKARTDADPRFRYIRNPRNAGPAATRNAGILCARGEYLLFVDSDDLVDPAFVERLTSVPGADIVWCNFRYLYLPGGATTPTDHSFSGPISEKDFIACYAANTCGCGSMCNKAYSREFIARNGLLIDCARVYGEDWDFNFRAALCSPQVTAISDVLYSYVQAPAKSVSRRYHPEDFDAYCSSHRRIIEALDARSIAYPEDALDARLVYNVVSLLHKLANSPLPPNRKKDEYRRIRQNSLFRNALARKSAANAGLTPRQRLTAALLRLGMHNAAWMTLKI